MTNGRAKRLERVVFGPRRQAELSKTLLGAAQPEKMAGIATFLASDAASYINAAVVHVNRGMEF